MKVEKYDNLYALDASYGGLFYSSWDNLNSQGFLGEILVQCEAFPATQTRSGIYLYTYAKG